MSVIERGERWLRGPLQHTGPNTNLDNLIRKLDHLLNEANNWSISVREASDLCHQRGRGLVSHLPSSL